jgi:hypothetical protein
LTPSDAAANETIDRPSAVVNATTASSVSNHTHTLSAASPSSVNTTTTTSSSSSDIATLSSSPALAGSTTSRSGSHGCVSDSGGDSSSIVGSAAGSSTTVVDGNTTAADANLLPQQGLAQGSQELVVSSPSSNNDKGRLRSLLNRPPEVLAARLLAAESEIARLKKAAARQRDEHAKAFALAASEARERCARKLEIVQDAFAADKARHQDHISDLQSIITGLEGKLTEAAASEAALRKDHSTAIRAVKEKNHELRGQLLQATRSQVLLKADELHHGKAMVVLSSASFQLVEARTKLIAMNHQFQGEKNSNQELRFALSLSLNQSKANDEKAAALTSQLEDKHNAAVRSLTQQVSELSSQLSACNTSLAASHNHTQALQRDLDKAKASISELSNEKARLHNEKASQHSELPTSDNPPSATAGETVVDTTGSSSKSTLAQLYAARRYQIDEIFARLASLGPEERRTEAEVLKIVKGAEARVRRRTEMVRGMQVGTDEEELKKKQKAERRVAEIEAEILLAHGD